MSTADYGIGIFLLLGVISFIVIACNTVYCIYMGIIMNDVLAILVGILSALFWGSMILVVFSD